MFVIIQRMQIWCCVCVCVCVWCIRANMCVTQPCVWVHVTRVSVGLRCRGCCYLALQGEQTRRRAGRRPLNTVLRDGEVVSSLTVYTSIMCSCEATRTRAATTVCEIRIRKKCKIFNEVWYRFLYFSFLVISYLSDSLFLHTAAEQNKLLFALIPENSNFFFQISLVQNETKVFKCKFI